MRIPIDVQYAILEHVDDTHDRSTLVSCSMLSHEWLSVFRPALFRRITVKLRADRPLSGFIDLSLSHPDVAAYIHELTLCGDASESWTDRCITVGEYQVLLGTLPHLRGLNIVSLVIGDRIQETTRFTEMGALANAPMRPLHSLIINCCDSARIESDNTAEADPRPLLGILCTSSSIVKLIIDTMLAEWGWDLDDEPSTHRLLSSLIEPFRRLKSPIVHMLVLNAIEHALAALLYALLAHTGSLAGPLTCLHTNMGRSNYTVSFPLFHFPMLRDTAAHLIELQLCPADITCGK